MNDPDMGYWQYDYDLNSNLTWQMDAKGQIIQFQYDVINRITMKDYPSGIDIVYTYDETWSTNSKGRLTTVTDVSGNEKFYYDKLGRTKTTIKTVDVISYQIDTTYDELGRTASIIYPDNETVYYDYDNGGNLTSVSNYATFSNFNALGQTGTITFANGVTTARQYYATNNRLYSITTNGSQGGLQNLYYDWYDNAGNVRRITDNNDSSRTQTFTYDDLNRLITAQSAAYSTPTITYQYDQIGNITYNSRIGTYTYGSRPHAVLQAGSRSYSYDQNGNMITREGRTITYDYDNRATSIVGPSGTVNSIYDYSGQRVKKIGAATTIYIGKLYECIGSSCTKYIFAGSQRIASQSPSKTYFYHTDHLGSSSVITDEIGYKRQETYYYPFGETRYNSGNATHYKFTGQEEDPETGLYYYGARYYDPIIGRFISADSIVPDFSIPQTLNRYSYCINNPIILTDPSGHWIAELLMAILIAKDIAQITALAEGQSFGESYTAALQGAITGAIFYAGAVIFPGNAILAGIVGGMAAGGCSAALTGGNVGQGMLIGAITGGIAGGIGTIAFENAYIEGLVTIGSGALIGGGVSELTGGSFSQGALIGGISAAASFALKQASSKAMSWEESEEKARFDLSADESLFAGPGASESYYFYAGGTWTEDVCFDASLGQGVKIYVKNVDVVGTTMRIDATNIRKIQETILLPQQKHVFKYYNFGAAPIHWRFCVSTFSDAFNVLYEITSTWIPGMPRER